MESRPVDELRGSDRRPYVVMVMRGDLPARLFDELAWARLRDVVDLSDAVHEDLTGAEVRADLAGADILLTGWGCPTLDEQTLALAPRLHTIVHTAGSVRALLTRPAWRDDLQVSSAADANAVPVAEYTLAAVLMANKSVLPLAHRLRAERGRFDLVAEHPRLGNYRKRVGVIGASRIGRRVIDLLQPFDLDVVVHDPFLDEDLDVPAVSLDDLLTSADVVSLHVPDLPETHHLIGAREIALMRPGATLINTARGRLVDTEALTEALAVGRINAVLDVTDPEPLPATSPLYDLPNVLLTPHVAGSLGTELLRLGDSAVHEVVRAATGRPLAHPVRADELDRIA